MNERKIEIDPISKQTVVVSSASRRSANNSAEETMWHPEISTRAKNYQNSVGGSVHERLYTKAMQQMTDQHNQQIEYVQSKVALPMKPWEVPRSKEAGAASWAQNKTHIPKAGIPGEDLLVSPDTDPDFTPVFVVECSDSLSSMWKALRTATQLDGFYEEPEAAPADL